MSHNDRTVFAQQTLNLTPGGAGITLMRQQYEHWLQVLMLVSGFVLLIVCANVANLIVVQGMERRSQISLSVALGARPFRLVRQTLTESVVLSLMGGSSGLLVAYAGTCALLHFAFPAQAGMSGLPLSAAPSAPVLLFTLITGVVVRIVFGVAPAWTAARANPMEALRGAGRSTGHSRNGLTAAWFRNGLIIFQSALSLVLLSASGLLTVVLHRLETQDLGIRQDHRIVVTTNPRLAGYQPDQLTPFGSAHAGPPL